MPIIPILIALAGGAFLVYKYWDQIISWLDDALPKIVDYFKREHPELHHAFQIIGEKVKGIYAQIKNKIFFKQNNKWMEGMTVREVPLDEVPPHIRAKIEAQENDITNQTKQLLPPMSAATLN